jgi:hypothetical protein
MAARRSRAALAADNPRAFPRRRARAWTLAGRGASAASRPRVTRAVSGRSGASVLAVRVVVTVERAPPPGATRTSASEDARVGTLLPESGNRPSHSGSESASDVETGTLHAPAPASGSPASARRRRWLGERPKVRDPRAEPDEEPSSPSTRAGRPDLPWEPSPSVPPKRQDALPTQRAMAAVRPAADVHEKPTLPPPPDRNPGGSERAPARRLDARSYDDIVDDEDPPQES